MNRLISEVLDAPEPHFSHAIKNWELLSGGSGHDLRLLSDIAQARVHALRELQLDETDTTQRELFFALRQRATATNQEMTALLKINDNDTSEEVVLKIIAFIDSLSIQREVWIMKHSVVKQLLKKHCPKKLLKILGLRSIDSVIKRTSAYELLALAYQTETPEWTLKMHTYFKKLKPTDFQAGRSSVYTTDKNRVAKLHKGGYASSNILLPNYETGTVLVVLPSQRFPLDVIAITLSLLQTLYELRVYSAYFRLISVKPDFGPRLYNLMRNGLPGKLRETEIGWKVLQRHLAQSSEAFKDVEQPHLQYDDIVLTTPLQALAEVIPSMHFWNEHNHIFMAGEGTPVSFHLLDVATNASNQLAPESGLRAHLQQQLWEELGLRYLQSPEIELFVLEEHAND